jgi:hypothetical protein
MVIDFTSFQNPAGITLKKIRVVQTAKLQSSKPTATFAHFKLRTIASQVFYSHSRDSLPTGAESFDNRSHRLLTEKTALADATIR